MVVTRVDNELDVFEILVEIELVTLAILVAKELELLVTRVEKLPLSDFKLDTRVEKLPLSVFKFETLVENEPLSVFKLETHVENELETLTKLELAIPLTIACPSTFR